MKDDIKSVLIDELGTTNSEENKHIINQLDHAFLEKEIKNLNSKLRTRKILALICVGLALLCTGVIAYNFYNLGWGMHVVILLFLSVILSATAGYEAIDINKRISIYRIIKELYE